MIDEAKVIHRENDYNFNLNFNSKLDWFMLTLNTIVIAWLTSAYYFESQQNKEERAAKEQESKAKSIKNKQDNSKVNLNNKSKP